MKINTKIKIAINENKIQLSITDVDLLKNCECRVHDQVRIRGKQHVLQPNAASIYLAQLPQAVIEVVSKPDPKPFQFAKIPLCEVVVCLKYDIPNHHDSCRDIVFLDGDFNNCRRENLLYINSRRANQHPHYRLLILKELGWNVGDGWPDVETMQLLIDELKRTMNQD